METEENVECGILLIFRDQGGAEVYWLLAAAEGFLVRI